MFSRRFEAWKVFKNNVNSSRIDYVAVNFGLKKMADVN